MNDDGLFEAVVLQANSHHHHTAVGRECESSGELGRVGLLFDDDLITPLMSEGLQIDTARGLSIMLFSIQLVDVYVL